MDGAPKINNHDAGTIKMMWEAVVKFGFVIYVLGFIFIAKVYIIMTSDRKMSAGEIVVEILLSMSGGSLALYIMLQRNVDNLWTAIIGTAVAIGINKGAVIASKEAGPVIQIAIDGIKKILQSKIKKNT